MAIPGNVTRATFAWYHAGSIWMAPPTRLRYQNSPRTALVRPRPSVLSGLGGSHDRLMRTPARLRPWRTRAASMSAWDRYPQIITAAGRLNPSCPADRIDIVTSEGAMESGTIAPTFKRTIPAAPDHRRMSRASPTLAL